MKKLVMTIIFVIICQSCNLSDSVEKLPNGYEFIYEGGNQNRLIKNNKLIIDSGVLECKYNERFIIISVDTTYSMSPQNLNKNELQYFIQDLKTDTIIKKISYKNLKKRIKENSLENLDITK